MQSVRRPIWSTHTHASALFLVQAPSREPRLISASWPDHCFFLCCWGPHLLLVAKQGPQRQHQTWTLPSLKGPGRGAGLSSLLLLRCCLCANPSWHVPKGRPLWQTLSLIFLCMQAAAREGAGAAAGGGRELPASCAAARRQPAHPQLQTWRHRGLGQTLHLSAVRCASREAAAPNRRQDTHRPMCVRLRTQGMHAEPDSCCQLMQPHCNMIGQAAAIPLRPAVLNLACCLFHDCLQCRWQTALASHQMPPASWWSLSNPDGLQEAWLCQNS